MNDDELKKRLSVLRSTPVPGGYWASYWPRLKMRLGRVSIEPAAAPSHSLLGWVPVCAGLMISLMGYWIGSHRTGSGAGVFSGSPLMLASDSPQTDARRAFKEMLTLFPNRVNWISLVDGKVDFSISSVSYKDSQPLVPLILSLPHGKQPFHAQLLLRPGQDATLQSPWDAKSLFMAHLQLDPNGQDIVFSCRLSEGNRSASLEGMLTIKGLESAMLGSLRWQDHLIPIQIARFNTDKPENKREKISGVEL